MFQSNPVLNLSRYRKQKCCAQSPSTHQVTSCWWERSTPPSASMMSTPSSALCPVTRWTSTQTPSAVSATTPRPTATSAAARMAASSSGMVSPTAAWPPSTRPTTGQRFAPPSSPRTPNTSCPVAKTPWWSCGRSLQAGRWSSTQVQTTSVWQRYCYNTHSLTQWRMASIRWFNEYVLRFMSKHFLFY